ncbi:MAG: hypothetical protein V1685_01715, partial [Parcubacteria group bacterium]
MAVLCEGSHFSIVTFFETMIAAKLQSLFYTNPDLFYDGLPNQSLKSKNNMFGEQPPPQEAFEAAENLGKDQAHKTNKSARIYNKIQERRRVPESGHADLLSRRGIIIFDDDITYYRAAKDLKSATDTELVDADRETALSIKREMESIWSKHGGRDFFTLATEVNSPEYTEIIEKFRSRVYDSEAAKEFVEAIPNVLAIKIAGIHTEKTKKQIETFPERKEKMKELFLVDFDNLSKKAALPISREELKKRVEETDVWLIDYLNHRLIMEIKEGAYYSTINTVLLHTFHRPTVRTHEFLHAASSQQWFKEEPFRTGTRVGKSKLVFNWLNEAITEDLTRKTHDIPVNKVSHYPDELRLFSLLKS